MKKVIIFAVLFFSTAVFADVKIGLVDIQKAIQETSTGKKAKKELETEFNKKKKELQKTQADLQKMGEDLQKKSLVLSDEVKQKKGMELQKKMRDYQEKVAKSQMALQKRERDLTEPIVKKLRKVIQDIAKKDNFNLILEKSDETVLYAPKEIDLTAQVVKAFEKSK